MVARRRFSARGRSSESGASAKRAHTNARAIPAASDPFTSPNGNLWRWPARQRHSDGASIWVIPRPPRHRALFPHSSKSGRDPHLLIAGDENLVVWSGVQRAAARVILLIRALRVFAVDHERQIVAAPRCHDGSCERHVRSRWSFRLLSTHAPLRAERKTSSRPDPRSSVSKRSSRGECLGSAHGAGPRGSAP